ncbi:MAG: hypothetical protein DRO93_04895, partial [Candidatus Thorarchaeota archaeon]
KLSSVAEELERTRESATASVTEVLDSVQNNVGARCEEMKSHVSSAAGRAENEIDRVTEQSVATVEKNVNEAHSRLAEVSDVLKDSATKSVESLAAQTTDIARSALNETAESLKAMEAGLTKITDDTFAKIDSSLRSASSALTSIKDEALSTPMLGLTEQELNAIFAGVAGAESGGEVAEVLTKVTEIMRSGDFPGARNTWLIATREAVLSHMQDMLQRAKSKVTMIIPDPREIPTDLLKEMKSSVGVELVVTEGAMLEQNASPLVGRGNIRVRVRSEKDIYACIMDSEEVMLAPASPGDKDVIGIVSENPDFVKIVMGITGPIFQARTKLLKPGDL